METLVMPLRPDTAKPLLCIPQGLIHVADFYVKWVRTWGKGTAADASFKSELREKAGLIAHRPDGRTYLFVLRVHWRKGRTVPSNQRPDVENVAKLITDAFIGYLYEDDDLRFVCGIQSECFGIPDTSTERTEVRIFAVPPALLT